MSQNWKEEIRDAVDRADSRKIAAIARERVPRVIRYLMSRLYSGDEDEKRKVVGALGAVVADREVMDKRRTTDLLRRFVWALNDESGAVPYGVPEAIGEVLAVRPEFQEAFLPILCALLTEEDMSQTGSIERGALWAVGRVGPPVGAYSAGVVAAVRRAAESHPDAGTRAVAEHSLHAITKETEVAENE
jgi:hypothetical protein